MHLSSKMVICECLRGLFSKSLYFFMFELLLKINNSNCHPSLIVYQQQRSTSVFVCSFHPQDMYVFLILNCGEFLSTLFELCWWLVKPNALPVYISNSQDNSSLIFNFELCKNFQLHQNYFSVYWPGNRWPR